MSTGPGADSAPAPATHDTIRSSTTGAGSKSAGTTGTTGTTRDTGGLSPRKSSMFSSLGIRNYRLYFAGSIVSNTGTWTQRIAQDWLVLSLTGSSAAVGVTTALQFLPMLLFGLYGGLLVDRLPKRPTLFVTQAAMAVTGLVLAFLTITGVVEVWHVYVAAFAMGLATVVDNPARQTFVSEMVGRDQLQNAVSLNSANFQSARLVGPAVGGLMITSVGTGFAFLFNGLSFVATIGGLMLMRTRELHIVEPAPRAKGQLKEGLRYVARRPDLLWTMVLVGFVGTFGYNFPVFLSAFADDVFHAGAGGYSLFNTLMAVGSLAGALLAARRGTSRMRVLAFAALGFGVLEIVAALSPALWLFALLMVPVGIFSMTTNVTANSGVQMTTAPEMRGRVMSLYMMIFMGGTPIGSPLVGWVTDAYGARAAFAACGVISALSAVVVGLVLARLGGLRVRVAWEGGPRVRLEEREVRSRAALAEAA